MSAACLHPCQPWRSWTTARSDLAASLSCRIFVLVEERRRNQHLGQMVLDTIQGVAGEKEGRAERGGVGKVEWWSPQWVT
jgi:hypothetical protein